MKKQIENLIDELTAKDFKNARDYLAALEKKVPRKDLAKIEEDYEKLKQDYVEVLLSLFEQFLNLQINDFNKGVILDIKNKIRGEE
jgi:hypothetical protein